MGCCQASEGDEVSWLFSTAGPAVGEFKPDQKKSFDVVVVYSGEMMQNVGLKCARLNVWAIFFGFMSMSLHFHEYVFLLEVVWLEV